MSEQQDQICLYAVGLMAPTDAEQFEAVVESDPALLELTKAFEDISASLLMSLCASKSPRKALRDRILSAVAGNPGLVMTDRSGRVVGINEAFTALCGYRKEEMIGRKPGSLLQGPATCPHTARRMRDAVRAGLGCEEEILNYHRNGSPYWVHIVITPLRGASGGVEGFAAVERKIKDRPAPAAA